MAAWSLRGEPQVVEDQRRLALQTGEVFAAGFAAEDQDEVDAGVLGQALVEVVRRSPTITISSRRKRLSSGEDDRVGLAEDHFGQPSRSRLVELDEAAGVGERILPPTNPDEVGVCPKNGPPDAAGAGRNRPASCR